MGHVTVITAPFHLLGIPQQGIPQSRKESRNHFFAQWESYNVVTH